MPETPATLEGRLLAHRKLIALLLARNPEAVEALRDIADMPLHAEDPGSEGPDAAFATEGALADEARQILDLVEPRETPA